MSARSYMHQLGTPFYFALILGVFLAAAYSVRTIEHFYQAQITRDLEARAKLFSQAVREPVLQNQRETLQQLCMTLGNTSLTRLTVILPSGKVVGDSDESPDLMENHRNRPEVAVAFIGEIGVDIRLSATLDERFQYVAAPVYGQAGEIAAVARVSKRLPQIRSAVRKVYLRVAGAVGCMALAAFLVWFFAARKTSQALQRIQEGAVRIAQGEHEFRIPEEGIAEFDAIIKAMNNMGTALHERIAMTLEQRNQLDVILTGMHDGVLTFDEKGRLVHMNRAAAQSLALDPEGAHGRYYYEIFRTPALHQQMESHLDPGKAHGSLVVVSQEDADLRSRGATLFDAQGAVAGVVLVIGDAADPPQNGPQTESGLPQEDHPPTTPQESSGE